MKKARPQPVDRWRRPKTLSEAIKQIEAVYEGNNWDAQESAKHRELLGLEAKPLNEYSNSDLKIILVDFEKAKMVIYQN